MGKMSTGPKRLTPALLRVVSGMLIAGCSLVVLRFAVELPVSAGLLFLPVLLGGICGAMVGHGSLAGLFLERRRQGRKENRFDAIRDIPAMLHVMDDSGRLRGVSQRWLETLGYQRNQVTGLLLSRFLDSDDPDALLLSHLQQLRTLGEVRNARFRLRRGDGTEIEVALNESALLDRDGNITETLAVLTDLTPHLANGDQIEKLAYSDSLTGLPNRALLNDRLLHAIAQARRDNRQLGVFFFDLDRFKTINDTQGHAIGDLVLRSVAQRLKKFIREGDTFARLGGDEFVIVQADPNHEPNFTILARRILEALAEPFRVGNREFYCTASIGVAVYPNDGDDSQTLLKSADTAMYVAKSCGRNNYKFFSGEMNEQAVARSDLETGLRRALFNDELILHYQPQIDLVSGRIVAVEAMLRWFDATGRQVPPEEVIGIAEESGLIFPLGEWILEQACRQARQWQAEGLPPIRMAVNISGHHIRQANFIDRVDKILEATGLHASHLEIETGESAIMAHVQEVILALTDLQVRGVKLAIDNFGTGYSSLLYLKHLPIQRIKITVDFIRDLDRNPDYATIVEAIIAMARSLKLSVTAIGVESAEQLAFLKRLDCAEAAGNFLFPPLPADEVSQLLRDRATASIDRAALH